MIGEEAEKGVTRMYTDLRFVRKVAQKLSTNPIITQAFNSVVADGLPLPASFTGSQEHVPAPVTNTSYLHTSLQKYCDFVVDPRWHGALEKACVLAIGRLSLFIGRHGPLPDVNSVRGMAIAALAGSDKASGAPFGSDFKIPTKGGVVADEHVLDVLSRCAYAGVHEGTDGHVPIYESATGRSYESTVLGSPKHELRDAERVKAGKVRLFMPADILSYMTLMTLFWSVLSSFHSGWMNCSSWCRVGMSMVHGNFDRLHRWHSAHEWSIAGDMSGYDASINRTLMHCCCFVVSHFFTGHWGWIASGLIWRWCVEVLVGMFDGSVWRKWSGLASGTLLTSFIGTVVHAIAINYVFVRWEQTYAPPGVCVDLSFQDEHSTFSLFGDDCLGSITEAPHVNFTVQTFSPENIQMWLGEIGLKWTFDRGWERHGAGSDFLGLVPKDLHGEFVPIVKMPGKVWGGIAYSPNADGALASQMDSALLQFAFMDEEFAFVSAVMRKCGFRHHAQVHYQGYYRSTSEYGKVVAQGNFSEGPPRVDPPPVADPATAVVGDDIAWGIDVAASDAAGAFPTPFEEVRRFVGYRVLRNMYLCRLMATWAPGGVALGNLAWSSAYFWFMAVGLLICTGAAFSGDRTLWPSYALLSVSLYVLDAYCPRGKVWYEQDHLPLRLKWVSSGRSRLWLIFAGFVWLATCASAEPTPRASGVDAASSSVVREGSPVHLNVTRPEFDELRRLIRSPSPPSADGLEPVRAEGNTCRLDMTYDDFQRMIDIVRLLRPLPEPPVVDGPVVSESSARSASQVKKADRKRKRRANKSAAKPKGDASPEVVAEGKAKAVKFVPTARKVRRPSVSSVKSGGSARSRGSVKSAASVRSRASSRAEGRSRKPKVRPEGGIVGMSPAGSDNISGTTTYAANAGHIVSDYVDMLVNPWSGKLCRLPDNCITPTSLFKQYANRTYTVADTTGRGSTLLLACHSRLSNYSTTPPLAAVGVSFQPGAVRVSQYEYTPGNILKPQQYKEIGPSSGFTNADGSVTEGPWGDDYGPQQIDMCSWVASYRVLSMAIRVRIVGLPSGVFMTPGKVYFAQIRAEAEDVPLVEQDFVVLEQKGRASHVSADAVREAGSKTFFVTPDGANKFEMSSTFLPAPGVFTAVAGTAPLTDGIRRYASTVDLTGPNMTRNGAPLTLADLVCPYYTAQTVADGEDQANADQTYMLVVAFFGVQDGLVIEADYAMCGEYICDKNAPPGIETAVQVPNTRALDEIFAGAAVLADLKPSLLQAPGDRTQIGATTPPAFAPSAAAGVVAESKTTKGVLMRSIGRVSGGVHRTRAEGFWDALSGAASSALGSFAGALGDGLAPQRGGGGGASRHRRRRYDDDDDY